MTNAWARFARLTEIPAPQWIAEVVEELEPGQYRAAIVPTGALVMATGPEGAYETGDRVLVRGTAIADAAPAGEVVLLEV